MITTPSHAIELLGGHKAVAERLSKPVTTVASWVERQSIPVETWPKLVSLAKEKSLKGFTYEAMVHAHAQVKGRAA